MRHNILDRTTKLKIEMTITDTCKLGCRVRGTPERYFLYAIYKSAKDSLVSKTITHSKYAESQTRMCHFRSIQEIQEGSFEPCTSPLKLPSYQKKSWFEFYVDKQEKRCVQHTPVSVRFGHHDGRKICG